MDGICMGVLLPVLHIHSRMFRRWTDGLFVVARQICSSSVMEEVREPVKLVVSVDWPSFVLLSHYHRHHHYCIHVLLSFAPHHRKIRRQMPAAVAVVVVADNAGEVDDDKWWMMLPTALDVPWRRMAKQQQQCPHC